MLNLVGTCTVQVPVPTSTRACSVPHPRGELSGAWVCADARLCFTVAYRIFGPSEVHIALRSHFENIGNLVGSMHNEGHIFSTPNLTPGPDHQLMREWLIPDL